MGEPRFNLLKKEVIDEGFCVLCGACSGFCNRIELSKEDGLPCLVLPCVLGCSSCYDHCPARINFNSNNIFGKTRSDPVIGPYTEIKAVRSTDKTIIKGSQDGGAVTAILSAILDRGKVDAVVVVERDETWRPHPRIITSKEELHSSRGSKYSPSPNMESLGQAFSELDIKSIAIVDVGCHIRALRNLEYNLLYNIGFSPYSDLKIYTIGLFCSGSFEHGSLINKLERDPRGINKMDVRGGKFITLPDKGTPWPVKKMEDIFMRACPLCVDYASELADISVGSIGSPNGHTTVIVRNLMGWGMLRDAVQRGFAKADGSLIDLDRLKTLVESKKQKARLAIRKKCEDGEAIPGFISI